MIAAIAAEVRIREDLFFFLIIIEIPTAKSAWDLNFNESVYPDNVTTPKPKSSEN
jgi:hypothetical protein